MVAIWFWQQNVNDKFMTLAKMNKKMINNSQGKVCFKPFRCWGQSVSEDLVKNFAADPLATQGAMPSAAMQ